MGELCKSNWTDQDTVWWGRADSCGFKKPCIRSGQDWSRLDQLIHYRRWCCLLWSTLQQSRLNTASLKCPSVRAYVRTSVRPSTRRFSDFNEIWCVGRGRWVMNNGMQYDPIQGQGHEPFRVVNPAIFKRYLLRHFQLWELATDHWFLKWDHNI